MKCTSRTGNQKGFSLLEMLVAVTLLAVGLMAVATMQTTAIGANGIANKSADITSLGQQVTEDILSWSAKSPLLVTNADNLTYDLDPSSSKTTVTLPSSGTFQATYSIKPNTPINKVTRIDVTITGENDKILKLIAYKRVE